MNYKWRASAHFPEMDFEEQKALSLCTRVWHSGRGADTVKINFQLVSVARETLDYISQINRFLGVLLEDGSLDEDDTGAADPCGGHNVHTGQAQGCSQVSCSCHHEKTRAWTKETKHAHSLAQNNWPRLLNATSISIKLDRLFQVQTLVFHLFHSILRDWSIKRCIRCLCV